MVDDAIRELRRWIWLLIAAPSLLLWILVSAWSAWDRYASREALWATSARGIRDQFNSIIAAEAGRLQFMSELPAVSAYALAAQRAEGERVASDEKIERDWGKAAPDDILVRRITENEAASLFRRYRDTRAYIRELLMTDSRGAVLAAPEKTPKYSFREEDWWLTIRNAYTERVFSPGLLPDGTLCLSVAIFRPGRAGLAAAYVISRIDLDRLASPSGLRSSDDRIIALFYAGQTWLAGGVSKSDPRMASFLSQVRSPGEGVSGRAGGYRYRTYSLGGGIDWHGTPVLIVAEKAEFTLLMPLVVFLTGALALGALAFFMPAHLARLAIEPYREQAEAGAWILRNALGRETVPNPKPGAVQKELAAWFSRAEQALQQRKSDVADQLERDLEMATEFQCALLSRPYPVVPEVHVPGRLRLEFAHRYKPALAIGGDFFDIVALATDTAGIFVGDVMGHGTRSALIVAILRTLIAEQSRRARNAPHFIREINNEFCRILQNIPQTIFASAAYFVADTTSRVATYAVAGHPPPFYLHRAVGRVSRLELPKPHGLALGLMAGEEYGGGTVRLNEGDCFVFFTDGVYEAVNTKGEEFGIQRLERVLRAHVYKPADEILGAVVDAIAQFTGDQPQADDICLVAVDVRTDPRPENRG